MNEIQEFVIDIYLKKNMKNETGNWNNVWKKEQLCNSIFCLHSNILTPDSGEKLETNLQCEVLYREHWGQDFTFNGPHETKQEGVGEVSTRVFS